MVKPRGNHHWCFVPTCRSTSTTSPDKRFITVPRDMNTRKLWWQAAHREYPIATGNSYCCEDHFNLEEDLQNYRFLVTMGGAARLKEGVLPHIFKCQRSGLTANEKRTNQRKRKIREIRDIIENYDPDSSHSTNAADYENEDGDPGHSAQHAIEHIIIQDPVESSTDDEEHDDLEVPINDTLAQDEDSMPSDESHAQSGHSGAAKRRDYEDKRIEAYMMENFAAQVDRRAEHSVFASNSMTEVDDTAPGAQDQPGHPWPHLEEYFALSSWEDKNVVFSCVLCRPKDVFIKGHKSSLSNLKVHVRRKHHQEYSQFDEKVKAGSCRGKQGQSRSFGLSQLTSAVPKRALHPSIAEAFGNTTGVPQGEAYKEIVDFKSLSYAEDMSIPEEYQSSQMDMEVASSSSCSFSTSVPPNPWPFLDRYFIYIGAKENSFEFKCILCAPKDKILSVNKKSMYNLKVHVSRVHPGFYREVNRRIAIGTKEKSTAYALRPRAVTQSSLDNKVIALFAENMIPLEVVDSPSFRDLIKTLQPGKDVISRRSLRHRMEERSISNVGHTYRDGVDDSQSATAIESEEERSVYETSGKKKKDASASDVDKVIAYLNERRTRKHDDLDHFFISACQSTRRLSRKLQNQIKRDLMDSVVRAEEHQEHEIPRFYYTPPPFSVTSIQNDSNSSLGSLQERKFSQNDIHSEQS